MLHKKRNQGKKLVLRAKIKTTSHLLVCGLVLSSLALPMVNAFADGSEPEVQTELTAETATQATEISSELVEEIPTALEEQTLEEQAPVEETIETTITESTSEQVSTTLAEDVIVPEYTTTSESAMIDKVEDEAETILPQNDVQPEVFTFTVNYETEDGTVLRKPSTYDVTEGSELNLKPTYAFNDSSPSQTYVLAKEQSFPGFDGRSVYGSHSSNLREITFKYVPRTYSLGENGYWYADDLENSQTDGINGSEFIDLNFTFTDEETGEIIGTYKWDKWSLDVELGLSLKLHPGIDTTKYGIYLASQSYLTQKHVGLWPLVSDGVNPINYCGFYLSAIPGTDNNDFFNDGFGTMNLTVPLGKITETPTTPVVVDEENRPVLEQAIKDAKPYLNKDKYQAKYVDILDKAIKDGEQALIDTPLMQTFSTQQSVSDGTVFQPHVEKINKALADVKMNPVKSDSTNNIDNTPKDDKNSNANNDSDTGKISDKNSNIKVNTNDSKTNNGTVNISDKNANTRDTSSKADTLPKTGESVSPWYTIAGATALALTALAWLAKRKRA